jgi:hypothetical protein
MSTASGRHEDGRLSSCSLPQTSAPPGVPGGTAFISRDPRSSCLTPDCDSPRRGRFTLSGVVCCLQTLNIVLTTYFSRPDSHFPDAPIGTQKPIASACLTTRRKAENLVQIRKRPARDTLRPHPQQERMINKRRLVSMRQGFVFVRFVTPISCVSLMWITGRRKSGISHLGRRRVTGVKIRVGRRDTLPTPAATERIAPLHRRVFRSCP